MRLERSSTSKNPMRHPFRLGLAALVLWSSAGCDGTEGGLISGLTTPLSSPAPTPVATVNPIFARSTPAPAFGSGTAINTNASATNGPAMTGNPNPAAPPLPRDTSQEASASYSVDVAGTLRGYCFSCHSPGGSGYASLALFDNNGRTDYPTIRDNINLIISSISTGRMPPSGLQVPTSQLDKLRSWQRNGSQLN